MSKHRPIRVLLTVPHLTSTAAPYRHMMALAKYLPRDRFALSICTLRRNGWDETKPLLDQLGVSLFSARYREKITSPKRFFRWLRGWRELEGYGPFDIQHSMDFSSIPLEGLACRLRGRPYIYSHRNMLDGKHFFLQGIKFRLSQRIICISDAVEKLVQKQGVPTAKIRKVYNGIDLDLIESQMQPNVEKSPYYVLFVGHIRPLKRQEDAIRAVAQLASELPDIRLGFAGNIYDQPYYEMLQQLVVDLDVADRVEFLGTRKDIPALMQSASALILCSSMDALPLTILEGMTVGVPIVASDVDGNKELIQDGHSGFLVKVGDIGGYADRLQRLLTDSELAINCAQNARQLIKGRYSAPIMVAGIADVYEEVALYNSLKRER